MEAVPWIQDVKAGITGKSAVFELRRSAPDPEGKEGKENKEEKK